MALIRSKEVIARLYLSPCYGCSRASAAAPAASPPFLLPILSLAVTSYGLQEAMKYEF